MHSALQNQFNVDAILKDASDRCGLHQFGQDDFRPGLEMFIRSCREDGYVSGPGFDVIRENLVGILINRLRFEEELVNHPEILAEEIVSPLVIIGAGRVGSTKMHRLLASAPDIQSLPFWQLMNPARLSGSERADTDPRIALTTSLCQQIEQHLPQLFAAIEPIATAPDEDAHLLNFSFMQFYFAGMAYAPTYLEWIFEQDWKPAYGYLKKLLQYLQWQNGTAAKPMILKGPMHTAYMDVLNDLLPGARFVQIHRDPVVCAASLAKVTYLLAQMAQGLAEKRQFGELLEDYLCRTFLRNLDIRERRPDIEVADYYYEDVHTNALKLAEEIIAFWDVPISEESRQAMRSWERGNQQHKFGVFEYSIDEMGIDRPRMEMRLEPYMKRFFGAVRPI